MFDTNRKLVELSLLLISTVFWSLSVPSCPIARAVSVVSASISFPSEPVETDEPLIVCALR